MAQLAERVWKGDPDLEQFLVPIDELRPWPTNPRTHDLPTIAKSLGKYGQLRPVIVQKSSGLLVAGHGTTEAARDLLGWTHLARVTPDLGDDEAQQFLLMDNRSSDLGGYDLDLLTEALNDLSERGLLDGTGYSPDDIDELLADLHRQPLAPSAPSGDSDGGGEGTGGERRRGSTGGGEMKELVLLFDADHHGRFSSYVSMLQREYGTSGPTETVYQAVERAAKAL